MKLRCATNTSYRLILIIFITLFIGACGNGDDGSKLASSSEEDNKNGSGSDNVIAAHNPRSSQFEKDCLKCHSDIPKAQSLEPSIPSAHVAMLAFTPGEKSTQCVWCHTDVSANLIQANAAPGPFLSDIRKDIDTQLCGICHGPVGPGKKFYQTGLTASGDPDGAQLYHYLCAACHKELANSDVKGESTKEIYKKIAEDEGGMGPLSVLHPEWIQAITVALGGDPTLPPNLPTPGPGPGGGTGGTVGASLYQANCSNCHGPLASSSKAGRTAAQIQNAILNNTGTMGSLSFLTAQQVQSIADALSGGGGGTGGGTGDGGDGGGTGDGESDGKGGDND